MKHTCKQCGNEFEITQSEINFYRSKKLSLPKRCKECREANKQDKQDKRQEQNQQFEYRQKPRQNKSSGYNKQSKQNRSLEYNKQTKFNKNSEYNKQLKQDRNSTYNKQSGQTKEFSNQNKQNIKFEYNNNPKKPETNMSNGTAPVQQTQQPNPKRRGGIFKYIAAAILVIIVAVASLLGGSAKEVVNEYSELDTSNQTISFRNNELLNDHYEKHGIAMGFATAGEYEAAACKVVQNSASLHKTEAEDGDDVYYLESTNEFVVISTDGYIRTYFCPDDGLEYYNRQ